ncbi:hypothetical protein C1N56_04830 [Pantoea sp. SGAir0175]
MRPGASVCRKIKLKNFPDAKPAGGCGVAPILSAKHLFCRGLWRSQRHAVLTISLRYGPCNGCA